MNTFRIVLFTVVLLRSLSLTAQTYEEWTERSFSYLEEKQYAKAEEALVSALRLQPGNPNNGLLLSNLGTVQREQKKYTQALISYTSGLMMMPKSVTLLMNRASLFCEIDSLYDALADYSAAVLLDDKNADVYYLRGLLKLQLADTMGARKDFEQIIELDFNSAKGRIGLAALGKYIGNYSDSEQLLTMVIASNKKNAGLYFDRSEVYLLQNKLTKAMADIDKSIELDPDNPYAYLLRAKIKLRLYESKSANDDFERARSLGLTKQQIDEAMK